MPEASVAVQEGTNTGFTAVYEQGFVRARYEQWLQSGFAQAAYMARDISQYGSVRPETRLRVRNERKGMAIEKLGEPYVTCFDYNIVEGELQAEDGELFTEIFTRGHERALRDFGNDSRLGFLVNRHEADVHNAMFLQEIASDISYPVGTAVIINSPSPSPTELRLPVDLLEAYNYRPNEQLAMQWVAVKTDKGIRLQTLSLFNAGVEQLAEATSIVSGMPVEVSNRETMPWQRTVFMTGGDSDVARQLQSAFDSIMYREEGRRTFHGLEPDKHASKNASALVETAGFSQTLDASELIIEQVSSSLVLGDFCVDRNFMAQLLAIQKADGSYELEGSDRSAVMRVLNIAHPNYYDVQSALRVAQKAADAILWAQLRSLYDGKDIQIYSNTQDAVYAGVASVETHRKQGSSEYDCPGAGPEKSDQKSIFYMSADQLASAFMRKVFTTNCPLCQEKNVTATQENGTITCGSCNGCVEICTGAVIQKSRKQAKIKRESGKLATKNIGVIDWFVAQLISENKRQKGRMPKGAKYEKIAA